MVNSTCNGDLSRPSCQLSNVEYGELDSAAAIRMVVSCLSLMGALTIISITLYRREIFNHKVHPIFMLSIVDALLAILYIIGGAVWFRSETVVSSRVWCFSATLPTVILHCVTVNLTILYALLAYAGVRQKYIGNLMRDDGKEEVWSHCRTIVSYLVAWLSPVVILMLLFVLVITTTGLLHNVDDCSCWCKPSLGNLIPYAKGRDPETTEFRGNMKILIVMFAAVIAVHFLVGFAILIVIYRLMIKTIRAMRETASRHSASGNYGATPMGYALTEPVLKQAEFLAKKRVIYFLVVFMVTGFFNLLLSVELLLIDVVSLAEGDYTSPPITDTKQNWVQKLYYITLCLQSVTITQQGFLNAIVYGWTRKDFLKIMAVGRENKSSDGMPLVSSLCVSDSEEEEEEEEAVDGQGRDQQQLTPRTRRKQYEISREQSFTASDYEELEASVQH